MLITKRSGQEVNYDRSKIESAIQRASDETVGQTVSEEELVRLVDTIEVKLNEFKRAIQVEQIQDIVIDALFRNGFDKVGRNYLTYRYEHALLRKKNSIDDSVLSILRGDNEEIKQENSNKNYTIAPVCRDYLAGEVSKDIMRRYILPSDLTEAHDNGLIHIHDMDFIAMPLHNCCLIDLEEVLNYGTVINGTCIDKPKSFETACTLASQVCAAVSASQYGGMTVTLAHLAPFVDVSRQKHRKNVAEELKSARIDASEEQINTIAERRTKDSIKTGIQTFNYQINSLMMGSGQSPFTSVSLDINEVEEGQLRNDLALLIEETLNQRILGMKNEVGVYVSPAFPKLLYWLDENNVDPDSEWFYLTELAARCSAKRLTPDYMSRKIMKGLKNGDCYPVMGCRSALTPDRFTDTGIGNISKKKGYKEGEHIYYSRFNQGVVTLNLVDVACSSYGNEEEFWKILDERAELCRRALMIRHETLKGTPSDFAPIMFQQGVLARLEPGEPIDELLFHGYSTISLGYAGLWEMAYRMKGVPMTDPVGEKFAMDVLNKLNEYTARWKAETDIDFSIYGTPMETLVYKFARCLQKRFGIIDHVTDKNYITNSYHVHVTYPIDAFTKITFESQYQAASPGGSLCYIEAPDLSGNIPAVLAIIRHIYDTIMYAEINVKSDYCQTCGYDGEIEIVEDENHKYIWRCPNCGEVRESKLNVARRVCGYISTNFFNQGRTQEIKERVLHI